MNHMRQVVAGVMLTFLWPGMALSQTVGPEAQGKAAGQPEMREPYGFDQDRSREETGNQGRPIRLPAAKLPAPNLLSVMWSGGFLELTKQMTLAADPRAKLAGFRVYEQRPGEPNFHPFVEFTLDAITREPGGIWSRGTLAGAIVVYRYDTATQVRLMIMDVRSDVSKWAPGTYRHYAVATDAAGREGEPSAILSCTLLDLPVTYPTEGGTVIEPFTVRWTDVLNDIKPGTHLWESLYQLDFAKTTDPRNPRPQSAQHTEGACGITQTEYYYTKEPFAAGSPYLMVLRAYPTSNDPVVTARYGYTLGVSRPIHFSAGNPPPGRIVIMPRPPASPAPAPQQPAVRPQPTPQPTPQPAPPQPAARPQPKPEPAAAAPQRRPDPPPQAQGQPPQRGRQPVAPSPAPPAAVRGRR